MKPDKLRNLLQEMDNRVGRMQRERKDHFTTNLSGLRAEVQRILGKVDTLQTQDIAALELMLSVIPFHDHDRASLRNLLLGMRIGLNRLDPEDVLEAVPGQKPAAFQFGFEGERVVVVDQPLRTRERDRDIAAAALDAATEKGVYVGDQLAQSNCSPRLRDAFKSLQDKLEARANIVQVGMYNQTCGRVLRGDVEELSPTLFELLRSHVELVFAAASQFEDWRAFRENAVDIDRDSVAALSQSTIALVQDLRTQPGTDPDVAAALDTVVGWTQDKAADKRDVLALTGTLQNLWSLAAKSALAKEVASEGRKLVAKAIIATLLAATTAGALAAFGKVPGAEWIETTVAYFRSATKNTPAPPK
ncbi:hypothetical protein Rleg2_1469 [Rhizobium leguminosarum bv. trifolii WSM2304]|uniref:Uncharacterized protein n=1 Tax=Rhizobium leguminosarum bv. trifolii (strain WSM2304) TaxID=395492 RepID=A0ABF7QL36_RHILW|nr:hypothetical protein [Rhizobium leguminosarum]ACI54761.1 hypothetical protein Rleg2_1469 [Rhizobium leguminosarum bv. trifolii WSM2304]